MKCQWLKPCLLMRIKSYLFVINRTVRFFVASRDLILINCAVMKKFKFSLVIIFAIGFSVMVFYMATMREIKTSNRVDMEVAQSNLNTAVSQANKSMDEAKNLLTPIGESNNVAILTESPNPEMLSAEAILADSTRGLIERFDAAEILLKPDWELGHNAEIPASYKDLRPDVRRLKSSLNDYFDTWDENHQNTDENYREYKVEFIAFLRELRSQDGESLGIGATRYNEIRKSFIEMSP